MKKLLMLFAVVLLAGCMSFPKYTTTTDPPAAETKNDYFMARLSPKINYFGACDAFTLTVLNLTDQDIEIDWNKTLYMENGQTSGGFMFEGVVYKDRNNPKSPDFVLAKSTLIKTIWPSNLVYYTAGQYGGWNHTQMTSGEHGVLLTAKVADKEIREKMLLTIDTRKAP